MNKKELLEYIQECVSEKSRANDRFIAEINRLESMVNELRVEHTNNCGDIQDLLEVLDKISDV